MPVAAAVDATTEPREHRVVVYVPGGMFRTGSLLLRSNLRFHLARGAAIYGSDEAKDYPVVPMLPNGYVTGKNTMWRALFAGYNLRNVAITGENDGYSPGALARFESSPETTSVVSSDADIAVTSEADTTTTKNHNQHYNGHNDTDDSFLSVIDGVGWKWWCKSGYVRYNTICIALHCIETLTVLCYCLLLPCQMGIFCFFQCMDEVLQISHLLFRCGVGFTLDNSKQTTRLTKRTILLPL